MNEREAYLVLHKASGIKVGDTVKVLRRAANGEMGWGRDNTCPSKYGIMGQRVFVTKDAGVEGFVLEGGNFFPFFVLEKIASAPELSIDGIIKEGNFGCREDVVMKLAHAIIKECKKG